MEERAPWVARAEERGEDGGVRDDIVAGQVVGPEEEARGSREVAGPEEAGAHGGVGTLYPAPIERAPRVAPGAGSVQSSTRGAHGRAETTLAGRGRGVEAAARGGSSGRGSR